MKKRKSQPKARTQTRAINKKPAFLAAFVACASLTEAAAAVGMDRGQHYDWLRDDPEYAKAFAEAKLQAADTLKDDAVEWARRGIFDPIVYQGKFAYATREKLMYLLENGDEVDAAEFERLKTLSGGVLLFKGVRGVTEEYGPPLGVLRRSEGLLARLLKAFNPAEFGDKLAAELTGKDGGPIEVGIVERLNAARARLAKHAPKQN